MIRNITGFIDTIIKDLSKWPQKTIPWFRGESGNKPPLFPKIALYKYEENQENHLLQSFRRKAGGLGNVPFRKHIDMWLFLAQHYGVPTRLLDWTEGALMALYFAINRGKNNPRVYMLNPIKLNKFAGVKTRELNYPLSHGGTLAELWVKLAWQNREVGLDEIIQVWEGKLKKPQEKKEIDKIKEILKNLKNLNMNLPIAFPAVYQDHRMIAQRSCFTIHGEKLKPIKKILNDNKIESSDCLVEYNIDAQEKSTMLKQLNVLGVSAATIFPDLDHLAKDLRFEIDNL